MINVEDLVRRQVELYHARENRTEHEHKTAHHKEARLAHGPYLLISREKGAGGSTVGQLAGKRLGWQVFNNEIIDAIAQKAQVRRELIESLDERDRATIHDAVDRIFHPQTVGITEYQTYLSEILLTLGHQGNVVIVGRGAQFILPSSCGLRVRLVAPLAERIRRIASHEKLSLEAARVAVEGSDRERLKVIQRHFGQNAADPMNQDLIINTAEISAEAATEIVVTALQHKLAVHIEGKSQK
jgi:cytidylate kinase